MGAKSLKDCCNSFFETNGLQGELNEPMQFCAYCGHKLTDKEFKYFNRVEEEIIKTKNVLKKGTKSNFYEELGRELCQAFSKQLSHPYVKVDMCPDFDNLLILTFGRFVYKFMQSKKVERMFANTNFKMSLDGKK